MINRERQIFAKILEMASTEERSAYLRDACGGDAALRLTIEGLLDEHENPEPRIQNSFADFNHGNDADPIIGSNIGSYCVIERLGSGGMGEIYLARDTKLDREVALKLLPRESTGDPQRRQRFLTEAKAASALNHPNVCTIYEIGETDDLRPYLVMEYIEGWNLNDRFQDLDLNERVGVAIQICHGLEAAHAKGIVHRDVKPANIRIDGNGSIKVLDFGIAKRLTAALPESGATPPQGLTLEGMILGTPTYMSPEQALGRKIDHRSDIFSTGVLLYEIATGALPFDGNTSTETIDRILHADPAPAALLNPKVGEKLEQIILNCLRKRPIERYQSIADLRSDLEAYQEGRTIEFPQVSPSCKSIAVLPFVSLSSDPNNEFFSDGITEELLTELSKLPGLRVPARTSSFAFKGKNVDIREIGRRLQVKHVLEGSVRRVGNRLRITAQLINAADGYHLWSEKYDRPAEDVFAVQDEITSTVVRELKLHLVNNERSTPFAPRYSDNIEAYSLYLKGRFYWNKRTDSDLVKATECFQQVLELDPDYALAYSGIADSYFYRGYAFGNLPPQDAMPRAKAAAIKALELDHGLAEARTSLATVLSIYDWDHANGDEGFQKAISLNPNYATAYHFYGAFLWAVYRRYNEAIETVRHALELDPLSPPIHNMCMMIYFQAGHHEAAIQQAHELLDLTPGQFGALELLSAAHAALGQNEEAFEFGMKAIENSNADQEEIDHLRAEFETNGIEGFRAKTDDTELQRINHASPNTHCEQYWHACSCARLGLLDKALNSLELACEARSGLMVWIKVQPEFKNLHSHSRFQQLVKTVFPIASTSREA